jgi:hypothetical protein
LVFLAGSRTEHWDIVDIFLKAFFTIASNFLLHLLFYRVQVFIVFIVLPTAFFICLMLPSLGHLFLVHIGLLHSLILHRPCLGRAFLLEIALCLSCRMSWQVNGTKDLAGSAAYTPEFATAVIHYVENSLHEDESDEGPVFPPFKRRCIEAASSSSSGNRPDVQGPLEPSDDVVGESESDDGAV